MVIHKQLSEYEYAMRIERKYNNAEEYDQKNFSRCMELWRMYWGVDTDKGLGQIPAAVVKRMLSIGKQPAAYNLCRPTVDNIAGGIMMAPFGFDLVPVADEETSLLQAIKDLQYAEQEIMNWRIHRLEAIIGGLIYRSDTEMYIDRTKYGTPFIGRRTRLPGTVVYDPAWKTPVSADCKECFVKEMLTPLQMIEIYGKNNNKKTNQIIRGTLNKAVNDGLIKGLADIDWRFGEEYGENTGIIPYSECEDIWGSYYKVIQYYHMEKVNRPYDYVLTEYGEKIKIPSMLNTPQDKIEWLNANVPNWVPDAVFTDEEECNIQYVTAICPSLLPGVLLCNGPTEIQCGRLQFFPWSAYKANGEFGGIMDAIKDMQMSINWLENTLQYRLHIDGDGSSWYVDPSGFKSPQEFERWKKSKNKAGETFELAPGYLLKNPQGPARPVMTSPYPREAMDRLMHLIETMWPKISKVNPAAHGRSESAQEPAALYRMKRLQHEIEIYTIYEGLKNHENEWGEAYLQQVIMTHGKELNKKIYNPRTKQVFYLNKLETRELEDGTKLDVIVNNVAALKELRPRVIITESTDSPTRQVEVMQTSAEILKYVDQGRKPITYQRQVYNLTSNSNCFTQAEKAEMEGDHELELEVARQELKTRFAELKAKEMQIQMQLEQSFAMQTNIQAQQQQPQQQPTHPITGLSPEEMMKLKEAQTVQYRPSQNVQTVIAPIETKLQESEINKF